MIRELPESSGAVLGFEVTGKVGLEEEKQWIARIEEAVAEYGQVSALVVLGAEADWGVKAGLEDLRWVTTHIHNLKKVALVTDSKVWEWLIKIDAQFAKLVNIGEKQFTHAEIDEAWAWLKQ